MQQADSVSGGGRIKNDVVVVAPQCRIGEQRGELVKGGNLGGAGARELLLDALDHGVGQHTAHRAGDAVTIRLRSGLRVNFQRRQILHRGNGRDAVADGDAEHLAHIGSRVGADQQHALGRSSQPDGAGAGD